MDTRIYVLTNKTTGDKSLVEAINKTRALRFVAEKTFDCDVADQKTLVNLLTTGATVVRAGEESDD